METAADTWQQHSLGRVAGAASAPAAAGARSAAAAAGALLPPQPAPEPAPAPAASQQLLILCRRPEDTERNIPGCLIMTCGLSTSFLAA